MCDRSYERKRTPHLLVSSRIGTLACRRHAAGREDGDQPGVFSVTDGSCKLPGLEAHDGAASRPAATTR